jgi:hypothetical protein
MANTAYNVPGVGFTEVDNTVMPNATPGDGIGAIVINANRGYPNQRVLCTSIDKFHEYFGTPDDPNQYGHFAAQVYFEQGGATQLLAVRATQGDEGYAQIQYPYTDSIDKQDLNKIHQRLDFVDNEMFDNLKIVEPITSGDIDHDTRNNEGFKDGAGQEGNEGVFEYRAKSKVGCVKDIFNSVYETGDIYVYRDTDYAESVTGSAYYDGNGDAMFAVTSGDVTLTSGDTFNQSLTSAYAVDDVAYYETMIKIDSSASLSGETLTQKVYSKKISNASKSLSEIMRDSQMPQKMGITNGNVKKLTLVDWDDSLSKSFIVKGDEWSSEEVKALQFTEYGTADSKFILVKGNVTAISCKGAAEADLRAAADLYGLQVSDINNELYAILKYKLAKDEDFKNSEEQIVLAVVNKSKYGEQPAGSHVNSKANAALEFEYTWSLFKEINAKKIKIAATYGSPVTKSIIKPWQIGDLDSDVNPLVAISSTEVFSEPTGIWKDGYTPACETDGEPGNGDIESYQSNKDNQLVIAAIGPGEFGNDVGISIITPEAAKIPALYGPNAFSWLYRYDDEDKVDADGLDYTQNQNNLTWKKVYKINVYVKAKSKTAAVWGFGLDALTSSPVESWLVSNDPSAKDENGNSLWAPYVINGKSNYIYVSKKSVEAAKDRFGNYSMPEMTWSIYQMTGGTNSKLNNVKEKTKCLELYKNRKKATLDYLFNVEPIETFSGKQKYMAMQTRIGQIASERKMDLGIIQCTSKEAKTIRLKVSEGKMFSFGNGSYVAGYDDYDRYFDPFTSTYVMLPRSVAAAVACCFCDTYLQPWLAPAGTTQGRIAYSDRPMTRLDDDEFGQLFDINVNASQFFQGSGECLMAQKTMLKKESALNRVDIRKLCNYIEKHLEGKLIPYLYRKNTSTERSSMKTAVDTFIGRIQSAGGIKWRDVKVVPDEKNTHLVYVKIKFIPAESIERIEVVLDLNRNTGTITATESVTRL